MYNEFQLFVLNSDGKTLNGTDVVKSFADKLVSPTKHHNVAEILLDFAEKNRVSIDDLLFLVLSATKHFGKIQNIYFEAYDNGIVKYIIYYSEESGFASYVAELNCKEELFNGFIAFLADSKLFGEPKPYTESFDYNYAIKLEELFEKYKTSRRLHIFNGYNFVIDLASPDGKVFERILDECNKEIPDFNTATNFKVHEFFITIQDKEREVQIEVRLLNWLWKYLFEEVHRYIVANKKDKENYLTQIRNAETVADLQAINIDLIAPNGFVLNANKAFQEIVNVALGKETDTYYQEFYNPAVGGMDWRAVETTMPNEVKIALLNEAKKTSPIFNVVNQQAIKMNIQKALNNSFITISK